MKQMKNTEWTEHGSLNNLHDVHKFYCPYSKRLEKEKRNIFVKGTMQDVRKDFQVSLINNQFFCESLN